MRLFLEEVPNMRKLASLISLLAVSVLLTACQSTSIQSAWFDPNFKGGPMKKIDVVAAGTNLSNRRVFEDIFAQKLRDAGVDGVAGWTVISDEARAAQAPFTEAVTRTGAQGLLVVRLLGVDTRTQVTTTMVPTTGPMWGGPGWGPGWGGGWGGGGMFGPAMVPVSEVSQYDLAIVETTLYEVATGRVVWSANTQTLNPSSVQREAPGFADVIIGQLKARGLIAGAK
jgi:hypothetical protein